MYCLETSGLTHRYFSDEVILNNLSLQVTEGSIYGFLGANGAGKTTTLKLILGLIRKQQGAISVFGYEISTHRLDVLKKVGSLIETPSVYAHLTATENLLLLQKVYRCPKERIPMLLKLVGLEKTGNKKAGQFSLGMKQRLSIAIAMLNNPPLLILDEPTNGLDPNGIIEMRELLKHINREFGTTIVISSHLLAEIEKLVTHVGVISKGNMIFQGTLPDLIDAQSESSAVIFETSDVERTSVIIRSAHQGARIENGMVHLPAMPKKDIATINQELVRSGIEVYGISVLRNDLEKIFIDLIKN